jgi:hypothetical protein
MASPGERIEDVFPALRGREWLLSSPAETRYNCIVWAAGDTTQWWWPRDPAEGYYWPAGVERAETLAAFVAAYALLGYAPCATADLEAGYEKIAIFTAPDGMPTHAARQLPSGRWTSKLGNWEDIEHDLPDISGMVYGFVAQLMRRDLASKLAVP